MGGLTHLSLNDNELTDVGAGAAVALLARGALPLLEEFWLSTNKLGPATAHALAEALSAGAAPKLRNVWLRANPGFTQDGRDAVTRACKARKLFCQL